MNRLVKSIIFILSIILVSNYTSCKIDVDSKDSVNYTVSYKTELGNAPETIKVKPNTVLTENQLPELKSTGYSFLGWYDGDTKVQPGKYKVKKDITLTAGWERIFYTVSFDVDGIVTTQLVASGEKVSRPQSPEKKAIVSESYSFDNWYIFSGAGLTVFDFNEPINSDITIIAKWSSSPITYTVIFESMGGSLVMPAIVTGGQKVSKPTDPTKESNVEERYNFVDWFISEDGGETLSSSFDFDTPITGNITLYAKWATTSIEYIVRFNTLGGNIVDSQTVKSGRNAIRPVNPTKSSTISVSYSFDNWYTSTNNGETLSSVPFDFNTPITNNITLYAKWNSVDVVYTVTFNTMGGSKVDSVTVVGGQKVSRPSDPNKESTVSERYTFKDWYTSANGGTTLSSYSFNFDTPITNNITLYAKWEITPIYKVTFDSKGGTTVPIQRIVSGEKATRPENPTKEATISESYEFDNWYTSLEDDGSVYDFNTQITGSIILYAKWIVTPIVYTVTYESKYGVTPEAMSIESSILSEIQLPELTYSTYTFLGWFDGNEKAIPGEYMVVKDVTLKAKWDFEEPLTLECINSGTITVSNPWSTLKYKKNNETITEYTYNITVVEGDKICFFAEGSENICNNDYQNFLMKIHCTQDCYIYGNIMSLVTYNSQADNWNSEEANVSSNCFRTLFASNSHIRNDVQKRLYLPATTLADNCYEAMFSGCTSLSEAPVLPATTLADSCYHWMFANCTSLSEAPALPATTLADYCYQAMFQYCTNLTAAPALPATTLADYCYQAMFQYCTNLTAAPVLPATTLAEFCYHSMFDVCTNLAEAPALPATTLAGYCYASMFAGCNLTETPVLTATTLAERCYDSMFYDCRNLNKVKCLATDISASGCTVNWLTAVPSEGTFIQAAGVNWLHGYSGIPNGWTVQEAQ